MPTKKDYSEDINSFFFNEQNKKKQKELGEKFGMKFMNSHEDSSPELVNKFLESVQKFEEAYEKAEHKKVIEILKFPNFKKLNELTPENISAEINEVLGVYARNNINIDIIEEDEVSEEDFYRFLTEELPQHEMDFIDIEDFRTNFIYEDFHPCDKLNAKDTINFFQWALMKKNTVDMKTWLAKRNLYFNGKRTSLSKFTESMIMLIPEKVKDIKIVFNDFKFGKQNIVKADFIICFEELIKRSLKQNPITLHLVFELQRCEFGGFEIISCSKYKK